MSTVISSSSRTMTSSVIGLTMFVRLTRPRMASARLTSTFSPRYTIPRVMPCVVLQSCSLMTMFWQMSASFRVR